MTLIETETQRTHTRSVVYAHKFIYIDLYICLMRQGVHWFEDGLKIKSVHGNRPKKFKLKKGIIYIT